MTTITALTKPALLRFVSHGVDDAGAAFTGAQVCDRLRPNHSPANMRLELDRVRFVGWSCGFEPMVVAVWSYLPGVTIDEDEAIELAEDLLRERHWFADPTNTEPDFVL